MTTGEDVKKYMNIMALGLSMLNNNNVSYIKLKAVEGYGEIRKEIITQMDLAWDIDNDIFFSKIEIILNNIKQQDIPDRSIMAIEFCKWLDSKITYMEQEKNELGKRSYFSVYWLLPYKLKDYVEINALNSNWKETEIWINPKYDIVEPYKVYNDGSKHKKKIANRDIFEGINGELTHCSYFIWDKKRYVKNIIISADIKNKITLAFSPLSDSKNIVEKKETHVEHDGILFKAIEISNINEKENILDRLKKDWMFACSMSADIFFAPEILGTQLSEKNDDEYNELINNLANERLSKGEATPKITLLPSYWHNRHNIVTITNGEGQIMAHQEKHIPYIDKSNMTMEAIDEQDEWTTVLIHIPFIHRIAVVVCAEFLDDIQRIQKFICGSLGTTILIVPSFSKGEQDFVNTISSLKQYGTSVIWGNCCGAIKTNEKAIGGCGIAGMPSTILFGNKCKCNYSCNNIDACVFKIDIPLKFEINKQISKVVSHSLLKSNF